MKILDIDGKTPIYENIRDGKHGLYCPLCSVRGSRSNRQVKDFIRLCLARCDYMYPYVDRILATDDAADVSEWVAVNSNAIEDILALLGKDPDEYARMTAARHSRLADAGMILK